MNVSGVRARFRAAFFHLVGSAVVASLAALLVFVVWYPWPYTALAGGLGLMVLITVVDVVIGPVITIAIFDQRKARTELRRDVSLVICLQIAALAYGLFTMYSARPVALALETDRFRVATANAIPAEDLARAPAPFNALSVTGPLMVRTLAPSEPGEMMEAIDKALAGTDLGVRPPYWRAWDATAREQIKKAGRPLSELEKRYPKRVKELHEAVGRTRRPMADIRFLPIVSRFADWVALIDIQSGDVVGFAPFNAY
jgi:hypothetical protein